MKNRCWGVGTHRELMNAAYKPSLVAWPANWSERSICICIISSLCFIHICMCIRSELIFEFAFGEIGLVLPFSGAAE